MLEKLLFLASALSVTSAAVVTLSSYNVDPNGVTVSGISSGGYFAVQMHVAYSASIKGAGVVAGGPYYCAEGSMSTATTSCMSVPSMLNVNNLISTTNSWAKSGYVDSTDHLSGSPVYLLSGTKDTTVVSGVMDKLQTYYNNYKASITYKKDLAAGHAFVTDNYGATCSSTKSPYINNCGFDGAGAILQKLYGQLSPRTSTSSLSGAFLEFSQSDFYTNGKANGMHSSGWIYVPASCSSGKQVCKLHVVFHGCVQNTNSVGDVVVRHTGYNEWADTNNMIVVYPQTGTGSTNACWDWWGHNDDKTNYARKTGNHMMTVKKIIDRIASGYSGDGGSSGGDGGSNTDKPSSGSTTTLPTESYGACFYANNFMHVTDGRAHQVLGIVYANGSNQMLGLYNVFDYSRLRQTGANYYVIDLQCLN